MAYSIQHTARMDFNFWNFYLYSDSLCELLIRFCARWSKTIEFYTHIVHTEKLIFRKQRSVAIQTCSLVSIFDGMHSIIQIILSDNLVHRFDWNDKSSLHVPPLIYTSQFQTIVLQNDKSTIFVQYDVRTLEFQTQTAFRYSNWWYLDK